MGRRCSQPCRHDHLAEKPSHRNEPLARLRFQLSRLAEIWRPSGAAAAFSTAGGRALNLFAPAGDPRLGKEPINRRETMQSHRRRNSVAALALAAATIAVSPALAEQANLKSMSFDAQGVDATIHVISTDGQTWNKLKAGPVGLTGHMKVNTKWPGFVAQVAVVLGVCGPNQCGPFPSIWSDTADSRDYDNTEAMSFDASQIPLSSDTGIAILSFGDQVIRKCNEGLQADGPTKRHSFTHPIDLTFAANTGIDHNMNNNVYEATGNPWPESAHGMDKAAHDKLDVQVVCDPVIKSPTSELKHDFGDFDVENVKLFLTTYQSNQPGSNPGTVCPALKVTSRAQANQAGPVTMRIWRQKDGGPITSDVQQAWASFDAAKNGYFATYEKWEDVGTTSYFQFKTEIVEEGPFGPFDGWKDITVHCTSPGGGGFTDAPKPNNDLPKPKAKWQGAVTVADSAGSRKACPRKGQVFFAVTRPEPGDFDYRISCSNGAFFTGTATGYDQGSGVFEAYGAHELSINRTRSIQCTLQELQPAPVTVAVDKEDFTCNNPAIDPAADDIVSEPRPNPSKPKPATFGDLVKECNPSTHVLRNGRCVKKPGISIHCLEGYQQVGRKCVKRPVIVDLCKKTEQRINGKCVKKPEVSILCKKGFKPVGKKCVRIPTVTKACGVNEKLVRGNCVEKPTIGKIKPVLGKVKPAKLKPFVAKKPKFGKPFAKALQRPAKRVRN